MATNNPNSNPLWDDDLIQFARLISELVAIQDRIDIKALGTSMDLSKDSVIELIHRAETVWEEAKNNTLCPEVSEKDTGGMNVITEHSKSLPTLDEMMKGVSLPNGDLRRGKLFILTSKPRSSSATDPKSLYRTVPFERSLDDLMQEPIPEGTKIPYDNIDIAVTNPQPSEDPLFEAIMRLESINEIDRSHPDAPSPMSPEKSKELMEKYGGPARKHTKQSGAIPPNEWDDLSDKGDTPIISQPDKKD